MPRLKIRVCKADRADHKLICKIARLSKYTKDFSNMIFSGEDCYNSGRIRVAYRGKQLVGFTCFRHRKRNPATVLYFIGVSTEIQGKGVGDALMEDLWEESIGIIEFKVMKDNLAVVFYGRRGFKKVGEAYEGKAWIMRHQRKSPD